MTTIPTPRRIGWTNYAWTVIRRACVVCGKKVTRGIINVNDEEREYEPDFKVICDECYESWGE